MPSVVEDVFVFFVLGFGTVMLVLFIHLDRSILCLMSLSNVLIGGFQLAITIGRRYDIHSKYVKKIHLAGILSITASRCIPQKSEEMEI